MEGALHDDDVGAAGGVTHQAQRGLDRLGAGVGVEERVERRRQH
jgi:hypothetical protein